MGVVIMPFLELTDIYQNPISINMLEISLYKPHDTDETEIWLKNKEESILVSHSYEDVREWIRNYYKGK